jgi:broad specificity phosphatase PhoE
MTFGGDDGLSVEGRDAAAAMRETVPKASRVLLSPGAAAAETAAALGLAGAAEPLLGDCDYGRWQGRPFAEIAEQDPAGLTAWMGDAAHNPHGGESIAAFVVRLGTWLESAAPEGRTLAIVPANVIRALAIHVLAAPLASFRRIDAPPLCLLQLTHDGRRWALRFA